MTCEKCGKDFRTLARASMTLLAQVAEIEALHKGLPLMTTSTTVLTLCAKLREVVEALNTVSNHHVNHHEGFHCAGCDEAKRALHPMPEA